ncbi:MAG TPA: hypothetical protein VGW57_12025 [Chthoniobacterales bacterium]|nr:hypothetical protein [Chthoniobacterales bacterium]
MPAPPYLVRTKFVNADCLHRFESRKVARASSDQRASTGVARYFAIRINIPPSGAMIRSTVLAGADNWGEHAVDSGEDYEWGTTHADYF